LKEFFSMTVPSSRPRRPWPLWVVLSLFLAAATSVPAVMQFRRAKTPKDLGELVERIEEKHSEWHIVPAANLTNNLRQGFYICEESHSWDDLQRLHRRSPSDSWRGVVFVEATGDQTAPALEEEGKRHLIVEPFVMFGDPEMLSHVYADFGH
jgi:hypothetical protein